MHAAHRTGAAAAAVVLLIGLSGCIPNANISAHVSDTGRIEFGVCEDFELDAIKVSVVDRDTRVAETVWRVEGDIKIADGTVVRLGAPPPGAVEVVEPIDFDLSQVYVDLLLISHREGQVVSSLGHFDGADVVGDRWMDNSGGYRDSAC